MVNTGQRGFGFVEGVVPPAAQRAGVSDLRFKDDDAYHLVIGDRRLDQVLIDNGLRWVVELRKILVSLDYSLLTASYSQRGRKAFHPRTVLGLMLYGLFVRRVALRDLEELSIANIGAWWICGGHRIDHSTIGKFVQLHEEMLGEEFFTAVAAWVVNRLRLRPGLSSIDGTVIESAGSHWRAIEAEAARLSAQQANALAEGDPSDPGLQKAAATAKEAAEIAEQRCEDRRRQGKRTDTVAVVPSDPQAVIQPRKDKVMRPGYKACTLMHEAGVVLGQHVHPSSETAAVKPLLEEHHKIFDQAPPTLLLDAGFHSGPQLQELCEQGVDVLCPSGKAQGKDDWEKRGRKGAFAKTDFQYDHERDVFACPAGELLSYTGQGKDGRGRSYRVYRTAACERCELRAQCTTSKRGRSIKRYSGDEYKEAMALVLLQPRARQLYRRRMVIAEPVHAEMRERLGLRRFHRRGLAGVRAEFALYCIALNIKKALRHQVAIVVFAARQSAHGVSWHLAAIWIL
jgi:transposase